MVSYNKPQGKSVVVMGNTCKSNKKTNNIDIQSIGKFSSNYTVRKIVLKLLLYLYFRTKVLKFRHDILIK